MEKLKNKGFLIERDQEKDKVIQSTRAIGFSEVAILIESGNILLVENNKKTKYRHQLTFVVNVRGYPYIAPCTVSKDRIFIKTVHASRKYKYLLS